MTRIPPNLIKKHLKGYKPSPIMPWSSDGVLIEWNALESADKEQIIVLCGLMWKQFMLVKCLTMELHFNMQGDVSAYCKFLLRIKVVSECDLKFSSYGFWSLKVTLCNEVFDRFFKLISKGDSQHSLVIDLPLAKKWEDIRIVFRNNHDVDIFFPGEKVRADYRVLGFIDNKTKGPNKQWELLRTLSENNGALSWRDSSGAFKIKKRVSDLRRFLKAIFRIQNDPFYKYSKEEGYRIKILFN